MSEDAPVNTGATGWPQPGAAYLAVRRMQTKLHRWATDDPGRCFGDLFNLVYDPAFLVHAWERVSTNKGAQTAGIDKATVAKVEALVGVEAFLGQIRDSLKAGEFRPVEVRQVRIPKGNTGKFRKLGIPTIADRVVQASLKLVLEPIFEADFEPCSYGFRPNRRGHDAIAEIHFLGSPPRNYEWGFEADITACFDEISHSALLGRMRCRVGDGRVVGLVRAFLAAGVLSEDGVSRDTITGTPQGGILSPCLANIALSVLDEHFTRKWEELGPEWTRAKHRKAGGPTYRLVRYADDFVVMVKGTREHAEALWDETSTVLAPMGLRLSEEKTRVCHIDEGFDFLGYRIQRRSRRGRTGKRAVYTYPSKKALASAMNKVRPLTRREKHRTLADLLLAVNRVLQGWCNYFRHGVSAQTFSYLEHYTWHRVAEWIRKRHNGLSWGSIRRLFPGWEIRDGQTELFRPQSVAIVRYRYRGAQIPTPWASDAA